MCVRCQPMTLRLDCPSPTPSPPLTLPYLPPYPAKRTPLRQPSPTWPVLPCPPPTHPTCLSSQPAPTPPTCRSSQPAPTLPTCHTWREATPPTWPIHTQAILTWPTHIWRAPTRRPTTGRTEPTVRPSPGRCKDNRRRPPRRNKQQFSSCTNCAVRNINTPRQPSLICIF